MKNYAFLQIQDILGNEKSCAKLHYQSPKLVQFECCTEEESVSSCTQTFYSTVTLLNYQPIRHNSNSISRDIPKHRSVTSNCSNSGWELIFLSMQFLRSYKKHEFLTLHMKSVPLEVLFYVHLFLIFLIFGIFPKNLICCQCNLLGSTKGQNFKLCKLNVVKQGLTSHQTHYRSYWGRFLRVK